uniref:Uncharacterized protein n=1 Tax=Salarias fasciatus TaxID=181472 RepID=A0A672FB43_SALFA
MSVETQQSVIIEVSKRRRPEHPSKKSNNQRRSKSRMTIEESFERWRSLKDQINFKTDAELKKFLLESVDWGTDDDEGLDDHSVLCSSHFHKVCSVFILTKAP